MTVKQMVREAAKIPTPLWPILKTGLGFGSPVKEPIRIAEKERELTPQSKAAKPPLITRLIKRKNPEPQLVKKKARVEEEEDESDEEDEDSEESGCDDESDQYLDADQALAKTRQSRAKAKGKAKSKPKSVRIFRSL